MHYTWFRSHVVNGLSTLKSGSYVKTENCVIQEKSTLRAPVNSIESQSEFRIENEHSGNRKKRCYTRTQQN